MPSQEAIDDLYFQIAELHRKLGNLVRPGTVKSFDASGAVLDLGLETDSHAAPGAMHDGHWTPFRAGQKVVMLCPDGDVANGVCFPFGHCDGNPAPSDRSDEKLTRHGDKGKGATLHIRDSGKMLVGVKSLGDIKFYLVKEMTWWKIKASSFEATDPEEVA